MLDGAVLHLSAHINDDDVPFVSLSRTVLNFYITVVFSFVDFDLSVGCWFLINNAFSGESRIIMVSNILLSTMR